VIYRIGSFGDTRVCVPGRGVGCDVHGGCCAVFVLGAAFAVVAFALVVVGLMVMLVAGLTLSWVG